MKINAASVYIREKNDNVVPDKNANTTKIKLSGDGFKQYVSAIQDGVIEHEGVKITISDEARTALEEMREKYQKQQEALNTLAAAENDAKWAKQTADAMDYEFKNRAAAIEIARRIAKGGKVPASDEQKLLEMDPDMYQMAKQQALMARHHKKYKDSMFDKIEKPENDNTPAEPNQVEMVLEVPNEVMEEGGEIDMVTTESVGSEVVTE